MSAAGDATVFATGLTGCASSSESFELVRFAVGDEVGSGRSYGSDAALSVLLFCGVLATRLGLVD